MQCALQHTWETCMKLTAIHKNRPPNYHNQSHHVLTLGKAGGITLLQPFHCTLASGHVSPLTYDW